jgi:CheY-like chemotaxis protein
MERLLLVEDDRDDVLFFHRALAKGGHRLPVSVASDGEEAIAYLSGLGPFADRGLHPVPTHVILDFKLPKKSGLEVLEWIRNRPEFARVPVAILSSSAQGNDVNRARDMGIDHYWVKPVSFKDLLPLVERITRWACSRQATA